MRMLVPELRERVYKANMELPEHGLVKFTWGNVSAIDREKGLIAIKPSSDFEVAQLLQHQGVDYLAVAFADETTRRAAGP